MQRMEAFKVFFEYHTVCTNTEQYKKSINNNIDCKILSIGPYKEWKCLRLVEYHSGGNNCPAHKKERYRLTTLQYSLVIRWTKIAKPPIKNLTKTQ
jgi:hypothetical protein